MNNKKIISPEWIPSGYNNGYSKNLNEVKPFDNFITSLYNREQKNGIYKRKSKQTGIMHSKLGE